MITPVMETMNPAASPTPIDVIQFENNSSPVVTSTSAVTVSQNQRKIDAMNHKALVLTLKTLAAQQYMDARMNAIGNVANGTLEGIIRAIEKDNKLEPGTLKAGTIKNRADRNNPTGHNAQSTSPLAYIDKYLVGFCIRLSRMGKSLNKQLVTEIARDMIKDTEIAANYAKHIGKPMTSTITPGDSWYKNFMKRNSDKIKTSKENIMDVNRKTYCTKENFANMYDRVYHHMTEAGVAIKLDEEIMLDKDGKQVYSKDLMYGLPTRYKMVNPGNFLMMDETGCNTNQKKDGKVGGERYIVPTDGSGVGAIGSTTDLHFSCACFTSGLGTPVMCAIIFSSEQDVKRIPIS